jgi:hypothetical protein
MAPSWRNGCSVAKSVGNTAIYITVFYAAKSIRLRSCPNVSSLYEALNGAIPSCRKQTLMAGSDTIEDMASSSLARAAWFEQVACGVVEDAWRKSINLRKYSGGHVEGQLLCRKREKTIIS